MMYLYTLTKLLDPAKYQPDDLRTFHNWHCFSSMDTVLSDRMTVEVSYGLNPVRLPIELDLIRLHYLLDLFAHITETNIDPCSSDTCG